MNKWLEENDFEKMGVFILKDTNNSGIGVEFIDSKIVNKVTDWVYAIVKNDQIMYIGETAQTLADRIRVYYLEARNDSTNAGIRERLKQLIHQNHNLEIYAQKAPSIKYKDRDIQLRVDLERAFIKELKPIWNKKRV